MDGKAVRSATRADGSRVHLLSAFHVGQGRAMAQREIGAKTNEIPELAPAIESLDLAGLVVTLDWPGAAQVLRIRRDTGPTAGPTPPSATSSSARPATSASPTSPTPGATTHATTSASSPSMDTSKKTPQEPQDA